MGIDMPTDTPSASEPGAANVGTLLANAIRDIGIPPCPSILTKINAEMSKDEPDLKYLDRIISSDVSLAAGLIAVANSPFFGFRNRVRSVREALQMLGLVVASRTIAGLIIQKLFPPSASLERFWHASASIARLAGWLAQLPRAGGVKVRPDDAYTFGLFRDCGIPVLMRRFEHYAETLKQANTEQERSFTEVEQLTCPTNHAAVGSLLAQSWWLPDEICLAIRHHHDPRMLAPGNSGKLPVSALGLIAIVQLAEHLFQHHSGLSQTQEWLKLGPDCLRLLDLAEASLDDIYAASAPIVSNEA